MASAKTTTDHDEIMEWVESRGGSPARVRRTGRRASGDPGILRIDFPGYSGEETLEHIEWDEWFQAFEDNGLAFLYQEKVAGGRPSRFSKLVARGASQATRRGASGAKRTALKRPVTKRTAAKRPATKRAVTKSRGPAKTSPRTKRASSTRWKAGAARTGGTKRAVSRRG